jgi:hypothetical protein
VKETILSIDIGNENENKMPKRERNEGEVLGLGKRGRERE